MNPPEYSVVIATYQRPAALKDALASLAAQSRPAARVLVVDGDPAGSARAVVESFAGVGGLPVEYQQARRSSAATQRNLGAEGVSTPLIAFMDDDAEARTDCFARLCEVFENDRAGEIGGVSARIEGSTHPRPRGLLWLYYRLQAGYPDATYGGRLFGAAINCLPCYEAHREPLVPADWLGSTCVLYRTELFAREKFPAFEGYSFMEDVHLSARIARTHRLYFHRDALFLHHDAVSTFKKDAGRMARMRVRNQRIVAREMLGLAPPALAAKLFLSRIFTSVALLRSRGDGWFQALLGTWTA